MSEMSEMLEERITTEPKAHAIFTLYVQVALDDGLDAARALLECLFESGVLDGAANNREELTDELEGIVHAFQEYYELELTIN